jgi:formate hydrogenlyase subunit 4
MKEIDKSFIKKKTHKRYLFLGIFVFSLSLITSFFNFAFSIGHLHLNLSVACFFLSICIIWHATSARLTKEEQNKLLAEKFVIRFHKSEDEIAKEDLKKPSSKDL